MIQVLDLNPQVSALYSLNWVFLSLVVHVRACIVDWWRPRVDTSFLLLGNVFQKSRLEYFKKSGPRPKIALILKVTFRKSSWFDLGGSTTAFSQRVLIVKSVQSTYSAWEPCLKVGCENCRFFGLVSKIAPISELGVVQLWNCYEQRVTSVEARTRWNNWTPVTISG